MNQSRFTRRDMLKSSAALGVASVSPFVFTRSAQAYTNDPGSGGGRSPLDSMFRKPVLTRMKEQMN